MQLRGNLLVAQAGGPTSVINNSLFGIIDQARRQSEITGIFGAVHGIEGVLRDEFVDLAALPPSVIEGLKTTPGAALRACRYRLCSDEPDDPDIQRIFSMFRKYDIRYFIYNGGNDSMDTADKVFRAARRLNYEIRVMGVPKTLDNDLAGTDYCPGYGSAARYLATLVRESGLHHESMYTSEPVTVLVTVGRNGGWLPAACALARREAGEAPHLICFPEVVFEPATFLAKVKKLHETLGGVYIVTGEGLVDDRGQYVMVKAGTVATDGFGHPELGAVGDYLKELIESNLQLKTRVIVPDISQQSAIHCAAAADAQCAERVGRKAVTAAVEGKSGYMTALVINKAGSIADSLVELAIAANAERKLPAEFISPSGDFVTTEFISYLQPFLQGSISLTYEANLPLFTRLIRSDRKNGEGLR